MPFAVNARQSSATNSGIGIGSPAERAGVVKSKSRSMVTCTAIVTFGNPLEIGNP